MTNTEKEIREKVKRTPKSPDSITAGALKLKLADMVQLRNTLNEEIKRQVSEAQLAATEAAKVAGI
jgi:hypothetical protein